MRRSLGYRASLEVLRDFDTYLSRIYDSRTRVPLVNTKGFGLVSKRVGNWRYNPETGPLLGQFWIK